MLVEICRRSDAGPAATPPKVLLLAPPPVAPLEKTFFRDMFAGAEPKSRDLGKFYRQIATEKQCAFLDLAGVMVSSPIDGIHFDAMEHGKLAIAVAGRVRSMH